MANFDADDCDQFEAQDDFDDFDEFSDDLDTLDLGDLEMEEEGNDSFFSLDEDEHTTFEPEDDTEDDLEDF